MLLPASKKHTRTISISLARVFTNSPSFPSFKLKKKKKAICPITCLWKKSKWNSTCEMSFGPICCVAAAYSYLHGPLEKTPASQHRTSRIRLWACSVAGLLSVRRHSTSSSFSWKSENCSMAQRWTLKSTEHRQSQVQ